VSATHWFAYEASYRDDLAYIPMLLRYKLDLTGRSISLDGWQALAPDARRELVDAPFERDADRAAFAERFDALAGDHAPASSIVPVDLAVWDGGAIPERLAARAAECGVPLDLEHWQALAPFDRYALAKLGGGEKPSRNLAGVLEEIVKRER